MYPALLMSSNTINPALTKLATKKKGMQTQLYLAQSLGYNLDSLLPVG